MTWPALIAQAVIAAAPAKGVISYPPAFFAAQRPGDASDMLARIPGFTLDYGSSVRGFEGAAGNVLIDGVRPVTKNEGLGELLERIPAGKVARIDIIRGGAPGIDMQGKAVLANVVLKKDQPVRGQIEGRASIVPDGRPLGELRWQASGSAAGERTWETSGYYSKGFSGILGPGVGIRPSTPGGPVEATRITDEDDGHLMQLTGAYEQPLAGGRLRVNGSVFHDNLKLEEDDVGVVSGATVSTDQITRENSRELGANYRRPLGARASLELVGLHHTDATDTLSTLTAGAGRQQFELDRVTREDIARAVVKRTWRDTLSTEAGVESARNRLVSRTRFSVDGADIGVPAANVRVGEDRTEAFVKASWRPLPAWTLDGQVRLERSTIRASGDVALAKTLTFAKPRLLATWSHGPTQLRLRLEREVGQLDFAAFVAQGSLSSATGVTAGNPDLEPERAWTAEAAIEQRFWGRGALVLTATRSEVTGVVDRGPVFTAAGVFDRPANIGDGRRDTLKADLTVPLDRLGLSGAQVKAAVTRRFTRVDDPTTGRRRAISGVKPLEWEFHFTQDRPAQNLTWGFELYSGWRQPYFRFNALDVYKLDPFLMAFVEWRPRSDLSVRVELENITERGYRHTTVSFAGVRDPAGLGPATLTDQNYNFGKIVYVRVRKSFGG